MSLQNMDKRNDFCSGIVSHEASLQLRNLGTFERFRGVLHDLGFHNNVGLIGRYSGPKELGKTTRQLIFHALRDAIHKHPALGVTVAGRGSSYPYFERIERIDLDKITSFELLPLNSEEEMKRIDHILSENHSTGFTVAGLPLWRVVVLETPHTGDISAIDVAFIWHHVIGDGKSGLAVLSTILQSLNSITYLEKDKHIINCLNGGDSDAFEILGDAIVVTASKPLFPALEEILSLPMSMLKTISHILGPWLKLWFSKSPTLRKWSGSAYHCEEPIKTKIRHITIPSTSVESLVKRCRSERTTMTPFLQTLAGKVIMETFPDADRLRCAVAISMRRFFPPELHIDDSVMGLWVNAFHLEYTRNQLQGRHCESLPWGTARKNSQRIKYEIAKGETDVGIGMLRYIPDFRSALMAKMGKVREDSYAITNLGTFPAKIDDGPSSTSPWQVSNLVFSQSCHVNGSAVQFCIVTLRGGKMCIALSWQEGTILDDDATRIAENLREQLLKLATTPES